MLLRSRKMKTNVGYYKRNNCLLMLLYNFHGHKIALPGYKFQFVPTSRDRDGALTLIAF